MSYKIKKGDSLSKIAKLHGLTLNELMKLNNISKDKADKIAIGQELKIQSSNADFKNPLKLDYLQHKPTKQELPTPYKSNYTKKLLIRDNAKSILQQLKDAGYDLGKSGVDGIWGKKSQAALDQALKDGYVYDEKSASIYKKEKPKLKERSSTASYLYTTNPMFGTPVSTPTNGSKSFVHSTGNNPVLAAVEDLTTSAVNKVYRKLTGNDDDYLISNRDIEDIPEDQKLVLRKFYKHKGGKGNVGWTSKDYRNYLGTYTGGNRSFSERTFTPEGAIEHTLGQLNFITDPETGDVYMVDTYDWNTGLSSANLGWYTVARNFMGKFGSKDTDPDGQKRHYKVNLGNPKDWEV